eukprot:9609522-Karenia_brevis.AAC.1
MRRKAWLNAKKQSGEPWTGLRLDPRREKSPERPSHKMKMDMSLDNRNAEGKYSNRLAGIGMRHYKFVDGQPCHVWQDRDGAMEELLEIFKTAHPQYAQH